MIQSKQDYLYYMEQDRLAMGVPDGIKRPRFGRDDVWRWERLLRKLEYLTNCKDGSIWKLYRLWIRFKFRRESMRLGFTIPINTCGEGLYIPHYGNITINTKARLGKNCRIQDGVNVGDSWGGSPSLVTMYFYVQELKYLGIFKLKMM